ncbi:MAG: DUF3604 domain-containing protein, partial [Deltaproteobacteria bacterium]|nr:DUF3604 domain-containing protein [Deltaproteobacteria bacterium]
CSTPINLVAQPSVTDIALKNTEGGTHIFEARLSSPGIYTFSAADKNKTISGTSNPVLCSRKHPDQRIYWGDLHGHSQLSDGTGTPDDYFTYARFVSGLDVAALTDHDAWGFELLEKNPLIWEKIKQSARSHNVPHEFITFFGYEWTSWTYGHKHVLFPDQGAPLFSSSNPLYNTPIKLWAALAPHRAITISHHSGGGPIQTDWSFHNPAYEPVVEISSIHGSSECIDCPSAIYNPRRGSFVRDALQRGYRLGFVGSGDTHNGHPGMGDPFASTGGIVAFYASEKTRSALWNALQNRHVYATTGDR